MYGPDVYYQNYFSAWDFPRNMPSIWYNHFGFAESVHDQRAVVVGEYGGFYRGRDRVWHDALIDWLADTCLEDTFYWCINPNVRTCVCDACLGIAGCMIDYRFSSPSSSFFTMHAEWRHGRPPRERLGHARATQARPPGAPSAAAVAPVL